MPKLTKDEAQALVDAHEIEQCLDNEEEADLLEQNNPQLFSAYNVVRAIANGQG